MPEMEYWVVKAVDTGSDNRPATPGAINGGVVKRPKGYGGRHLQQQEFERRRWRDLNVGV